jgi:hypothetical protein
MKGKEQITVTFAPDLLAKVDALAKKMGQSRVRWLPSSRQG